MEKDSENTKKSEKSADEIADSYNIKAINKLTEKEAKEMCFQLLTDLMEVEKKVRSLERQNKHLKELQEDKHRYKGYNTSWTILEKIIFVLTHYNKIMTVHELTEELISCEPILRQKWLNPPKSVAVPLYRGIELFRIIRCKKIGLHGYTYALPEWYDGNGNLEKKHLR